MDVGRPNRATGLGRKPKPRESAGDAMRFSSKVTNRAEAKGILAGWAKLLPQSLDELRGVPGEAE